MGRERTAYTTQGSCRLPGCGSCSTPVREASDSASSTRFRRLPADEAYGLLSALSLPLGGLAARAGLEPVLGGNGSTW